MGANEATTLYRVTTLYVDLYLRRLCNLVKSIYKEFLQVVMKHAQHVGMCSNITVHTGSLAVT